jgi:hypothetical protein
MLNPSQYVKIALFNSLLLPGRLMVGPQTLDLRILVRLQAW